MAELVDAQDSKSCIGNCVRVRFPLPAPANKKSLYMLLVKTKIGPSIINGTGIFADQFIKKGTIVWKFQPNFDLKIDTEELHKLSEPAKEQFLKYTYLDPDSRKYILCFDDARFFNHSDTPNCVDGTSPDDEEGLSIADKNIEKGEELTCNYKTFDADFNKRINIH